MTHGGLDAPTGAEKSLNLLALCRRFNDQELHRTVSDTCGVRVTFAYRLVPNVSTPRRGYANSVAVDGEYGKLSDSTERRVLNFGT